VERHTTAGVQFDGTLVQRWADACVDRLRVVAPRIDALNVFPVADADTGQNVTFTLLGGREAVAASPTQHLGEAVRLLAAGSLRQARGSSGVIVSGWFAGLAAGLADHATSDVTRLADALGMAAAGARQVVADPWPGTVLEVAQQVADAVAARPSHTMATVLPEALDAVRARLAETSAHHPVLRSAGVIDAGACALLVVLEVLAGLLGTSPPAGAWLPEAGVEPHQPDQSGGAFEVMLHITVEVDRGRLAATGSAAALTGLGDEWRTHVHTDDPATAVGLVAPDQLRLGVVRAITSAPGGPVVVTADTGLVAWYAAAGAVVVVPGGAVVPGHLRALVAAAGAHVLATDPELAAMASAMTCDPVRAAVACTAADEGADVAAAVHRVRTAETTDLGPVLAGLLVDGGEVLTVVAPAGADLVAVRDLAASCGLELVLVGPASGPTWRLGVD